MPVEEKNNNWFLWLISLCCLLVIGVSFYFFYFKKDYDFIVETSCDSTKEECFSRDCTNPDNCPPNQLSTFKRYTLKASDFQYCENEDCKIACESGSIKCERISCVIDEGLGEICVDDFSLNNETLEIIPNE